MKQASGMQKRATAVDGEINKGYIFRIGMVKIDQTKVYRNNLNLVVIDIQKRKGITHLLTRMDSYEKILSTCYLFGKN